MKKPYFTKLPMFVIIMIMLLTTAAQAGDSNSTYYNNTISCGETFSMVIDKNGYLYAWGQNGQEQVGNGTTKAIRSPLKVMANVRSVSAGNEFSLIIKTDNSLWEFGESKKMIMDNVISASQGNFDTSMAIKADGSLWSWGSNDYGILGDGTTTDRSTPEKIMNDVIAVSVGGSHAMAIKSDGSLWGWGRNYNGQLGDGTTDDKYVPEKVMDDVAAVSCGDWHTVALKTDGSVWVWGYSGNNEYLGSTDSSINPHPNKVMQDVIAIAAGTGHTMVIKNDHSLWGWGWNNDGQLGDGTETFASEPIKILDNVASVSCGWLHTLALKTDGTLWAWGLNGNGHEDNYSGSGQLGDGTLVSKSTPVKVMGNIKLPTRPVLVPTYTVIPTASDVTVNGKSVNFTAYNINGNNYFKIRDLAMALRNTGKKFQVTYDKTLGGVSIVTDSSYTPVGGELAAPTGSTASIAAKLSTYTVYVDGVKIGFVAYTIGGYNYFKLRDVAAVIDFGVDYNTSTKTVVVDTTKGYTA